MATAQAEACAVSAVQATRETQLPYYGTIGGRRVAGHRDLYEVETVIEKPTPTEAELRLIVPGLRAGHYLCFFGMPVLTPAVMADWMVGNHQGGMRPPPSASITTPRAPRAALERARADGWRLRRLAVIAGVTLVTAGLIVAEPDLGSSALIVVVLAGMAFVAGMPMRHFVLPVTACSAGLVAAIV